MPNPQNSDTSTHDPAITAVQPTPGEPVADVVSPTSATEPAADLASLLKKAEDEAAELRDAWLRARADLENVKKQAAADVTRAHKYAIERFATELLAVKDALESTLASDKASPDVLRAGVELTLKQLDAAFDKSQIVEIEAAGQKFDPHRHQAMAMVDSPGVPNTVAQVFQKGYLLNDRVLRPAMVAVAKSKDTSEKDR
jgi:molecular chaperone GrpE